MSRPIRSRHRHLSPTQLSRQLRTARTNNLRRRRAIAGLSLTAAGSMALISLYQIGIVRQLPDPPLPRMDSDRVDASDEAYQYAATPDAFLGLVSYGVTASLAAMAQEDRARTRPWIPLALAGKVLFDAGGAAKLTWDQWAKHKAFCIWCLLATACTFGMLPLVVPETRQALRSLLGADASASSRPAPLRLERRSYAYHLT